MEQRLNDDFPRVGTFTLESLFGEEFSRWRVSPVGGSVMYFIFIPSIGRNVSPERIDSFQKFQQTPKRKIILSLKESIQQIHNYRVQLVH